MKKSKIIFISLLSTIAFLILAASLDIRINGKGNNSKIVSKHLIPSFKVLCINHADNVEIIQGDSSFIEIANTKDTLLPSKIFAANDDTLTISDIKRINYFKIYFKDTLKNIHLRNSSITIKHFDSPNLSLDMDRSNAWLDMSSDSTSSLSSLSITAKNHSNINTNTLKINSLKFDLHASSAYLYIITKKISGTLSDSSRAYAYQSEEIMIKKDTTSRFYLYD